MVRLVTRGDDAGSCVAANEAVEWAARDGVLKNASLIACGPAIADAAARLREVPELCIGLHLTLASEWDALTWGPLTRSPLLTDARGCFPQSPAKLPRTSEAIDAMLSEARAQFDTLRSLGLEPYYMDEHMGPSRWAVPELHEPLRAWAESVGLATMYELAYLPGDGDIRARLKAAPPGDYLWVNHPCLPDGDSEKMGNAEYPLAEILEEREADRKLWLELANQPWPDVRFVALSDVLTAT